MVRLNNVTLLTKAIGLRDVNNVRSPAFLHYLSLTYFQLRR